MCRPENQKEGKRKREEIKWEPGSTQKGKKSRSDREASREREHKHRHKEKYVSVFQTVLVQCVQGCLACAALKAGAM